MKNNVDSELNKRTLLLSLYLEDQSNNEQQQLLRDLNDRKVSYEDKADLLTQAILNSDHGMVEAILATYHQKYSFVQKLKAYVGHYHRDRALFFFDLSRQQRIGSVHSMSFEAWQSYSLLRALSLAIESDDLLSVALIFQTKSNLPLDKIEQKNKFTEKRFTSLFEKLLSIEQDIRSWLSDEDKAIAEKENEQFKIEVVALALSGGVSPWNGDVYSAEGAVRDHPQLLKPIMSARLNTVLDRRMSIKFLTRQYMYDDLDLNAILSLAPTMTHDLLDEINHQESARLIATNADHDE